MSSGRVGTVSVDGRSLRFQHRRGELLEAVIDYALEHGVADLSFRPLAKEVGVSHVTLRHHFGTKEDLLAEIFDSVRSREPLPATLGSAADAEALLRTLWAGWTDAAGDRYFRLFFEAYGQALMHPDRYQRFLDGVVQDWLAAVVPLVVASGATEEQATQFATLLLATLRGLLLDLLATGDRERVERSLDALLLIARAAGDGWRASGS